MNKHLWEGRKRRNDFCDRVKPPSTVVHVSVKADGSGVQQHPAVNALGKFKCSFLITTLNFIQVPKIMERNLVFEILLEA